MTSASGYGCQVLQHVFRPHIILPREQDDPESLQCRALVRIRVQDGTEDFRRPVKVACLGEALGLYQQAREPVVGFGRRRSAAPGVRGQSCRDILREVQARQAVPIAARSRLLRLHHQGSQEDRQRQCPCQYGNTCPHLLQVDSLFALSRPAIVLTRGLHSLQRSPKLNRTDDRWSGA